LHVAVSSSVRRAAAAALRWERGYENRARLRAMSIYLFLVLALSAVASTALLTAHFLH
jgi:hypothetical protein